MEVQIKKAVRAGNSSAVILPRAWLNKEVRVELIRKSQEKILAETLDILTRYIKTGKIIGIYLTGSYARGEEDENSDIDILIITKDTDKEIIKEGIYNILLVSEKLLNQKLKNDLFPIGQMLKEAVPLLNSAYLDSINVKVTQINVKWYLNSTEDKLKLVKKILAGKSQKVNSRVIYTLILRIRTIYIIKKLIKNEKYSKKEFLSLIKKISGNSEAYSHYLKIKGDLKEEYASKPEAENLYNYLEKQLEEVKKMLKI